MKSGWLFALIALAPAACGKRTGSGSLTPGLDALGPEPDGASVPRPDGATAPARDAAVDTAIADAGPPAPAEDAYRQFISDFNDGYRRRLVSCFNFAASSVSRDIYREVFDDILASLRVGLSRWDAAQAAQCVEALAQARCQEIASGSALAACNRVRVAQVSDDGYCLDDGDCREPGRVCGGAGAGSCGRVCARSLWPDRSLAEGQPCSSEDCRAGLYCQMTLPDVTEGTCRPIAPGAACDSSDRCPFPYTCVGGPGAGTCGIGKSAGQPCHLWSDLPVPGLDSDCSPAARCLAMGGGPLVCVPEPPSPGSPGPRLLAVGATCLADDTSAHCGLGSYCRVDPADLQRYSPPPRYQGICQPWKAVGQDCEYEGVCRAGAACAHGTCTMCPAAPTDPGQGTPDAAPPVGDGGCGANLKSDRANCGACGHDCLGGACFDGHCQPRSIGTGIDREIRAWPSTRTGVFLSEYVQNGRVLRVTPDGSEPVKVLAFEQNQPQALAIDATHVYWVNGSGGTLGTVNRVRKSGGPVEILATGEASPQQLALDDTHVYWTNQGEGPTQGVRRVAKLGGAAERLTTASGPSGIAVDATDVYWCDWSAGTVNRRAKTGGPIKVLAFNEENANRIALDARRVYWSSSERVSSVAKEGGAITVHSPSFNVQDIATDGESVYWTTNTEIGRAGPRGSLQLVDSNGLREIEVRGAWIHFVAGGSLSRLPR